jgi:hypothetical protein
VKQSVYTQHCAKSKKLHVSAEQNSHHQSPRFGNIKRKSYSRSYTFNMYDLLFIFLNRDVWRWMFCTVETCSFLDFIQCCVWTDCCTATHFMYLDKFGIDGLNKNFPDDFNLGPVLVKRNYDKCSNYKLQILTISKFLSCHFLLSLSLSLTHIIKLYCSMQNRDVLLINL